MSLFGSSPPEAASQTRSNQKSSLFDEGPKSNVKGSGLFDDDGETNGESPWGMPTPKKGSKGDVVKSLLPSTDVPESYIEAFDALTNSEYSVGGGRVNLSGIEKLLASTKLRQEEQQNVLKQVTRAKDVSNLSRGEFNVLFALIGLSLEGEEATLDSVDERRKSMARTRAHHKSRC